MCIVLVLMIGCLILEAVEDEGGGEPVVFRCFRGLSAEQRNGLFHPVPTHKVEGYADIVVGLGIETACDRIVDGQ